LHSYEQAEYISSKRSFDVQSTATAAPKRKKTNRYYIRAHPLPRILKRDIRREFGRMLTIAINSANIHMLLGYFDSFAIPTCKCMETYLLDPSMIPQAAPSAGRNETTTVTFAHPQEMAYYIGQIHTMFPDAIVSLTDNQILQQADIPGCIIFLQYRCNATVILPPQNIPDTSNAPPFLLHQEHLPSSLDIVSTILMKMSINEENKITCFHVRNSVQLYHSHTKQPVDRAVFAKLLERQRILSRSN
jgi:hypothetical protein